jgi:hypothetical protein
MGEQRVTMTVVPHGEVVQSQWSVWLDGLGPGVQMAPPVTSAAEAAERARQSGYRLVIDHETYQEMVDQGVAPSERPDNLLML